MAHDITLTHRNKTVTKRVKPHDVYIIHQSYFFFEDGKIQCGL